MSEIARAIAKLAPAAGLLPEVPAASSQAVDRILSPAETPLIMAPMASVADSAYRIMARLGGADFACSEMVSVAGLHYNGQKSRELYLPHPTEGPLAVQLFGSKPQQFAEAAQSVAEDLGDSLAWLDINMACPVRKVVTKGEGAALLSNISLALEIISQTRSALPAQYRLSVKIRLGMDEDHAVSPATLDAVAEAGVDFITIHGRYATQMYRGESSGQKIEELAHSSSVPVIISGDQLDSEVVACSANGPYAGVMVARGTYGNPWIFNDAKKCLYGKAAPMHPREQRLAALKLHLKIMQLINAQFGRSKAIASHYLTGFAGAAKMRNKMMHITNWDAYQEYLDAS